MDDIFSPNFKCVLQIQQSKGGAPKTQANPTGKRIDFDFQ